MSACPDECDCERALQLALNDSKLRPNNWYAQGLLGLALYRNDRYEEARAAIASHLEDTPVTDDFYGPSLFIMAMLEWKLGDETEARAYYDRGIDNIEATFPKSPLNLRFKSEAAQLLGIQS